MKFVVVEIDNNSISIVEEVEGTDAYLQVRQSVSGTKLQVWRVNSFEEANVMVQKHNQILTGQIPTTFPPVDQRVEYVTDTIQASQWNWALTTAVIRAQLLAHYNNEEWSQIMQIHNSLALTAETYCCSYFVPKIKANIEKAIGDGIL